MEADQGGEGEGGEGGNIGSAIASSENYLKKALLPEK
jgi:hypothetical protein